ncbi:hypothetical protein U0070_005822 [Myodes glareolus]|uniref:Glycophorin-A n=1 Tax=Myodes glareolus TaxID=447135 RepID=A0AAW0HEL4_MYOGA
MQESTASAATTAGHQEEHSTLLPESGSHSPSPIPMLTSTVHYQDHSVSLPVSGIIARTHNMALNETAVTPEAPIAPPVTIAIVLGVIAGIVGTILLIYYLISLITKKSSVDIQPYKDEDTDVPLSSIEQRADKGGKEMFLQPACPEEENGDRAFLQWKPESNYSSMCKCEPINSRIHPVRASLVDKTSENQIESFLNVSD